MSKTVKRIMTLVVALILIGALVGLLIWQRSRDDETEVAPPPLPSTVTLISTSENDVRRIEFISADHTEIFTNSDNGWIFQGAETYALNHAMMVNKLRPAWALTATSMVHEDVSELNMAEFGFHPPILTVEIEYTDNTRKTLHVGAHSHDFRHRFLMVEGDPAMYLVSNFLVESMQQDIDMLLDRNIPVMHADAAQKLVIDERGRPMVKLEVIYAINPLVDEPIQTLTMIEPFENRALAYHRLDEVIFGPLNAIQLLGVANIRPVNLSSYGLHDPILEIIYRSDDDDVHLIFGDTFSETVSGVDVTMIYVMDTNRPHVFTTPFGPVNALLNLNMFDFVDRFIALVDIRDVEGIQITTPEQDFNIVLNHDEDPTVQRIAPVMNGVSVSEDDFRTAYRFIIALSADAEIAAFAPTGTPEISILYKRINNPNTHVRLFRHDANFFAVSLNGEDVWYLTNQRDVYTMLRELENLF